MAGGSFSRIAWDVEALGGVGHFFWEGIGQMINGFEADT
jgi:hypothetical protein